MYLGTLVSYKTYVFNKGVDDENVADALTWLSNHSDQPEVTILLNTLGGSVHQGVALFDAIQLLRDKVKINIVAMGACQSAGTIILMGAYPERRFAAPNTRFMIHPPRVTMGNEKYTAWGTPPSAELLEIMDQLAGHTYSETYALREHLLDLMVANTRLGRDEATAAYDATTHFHPEKALEIGFIGSILKPDLPAAPAPVIPPKKWWQRRSK